MNAVLIWALIVANCAVAVVVPVWLLLLVIRLFHRLCGRPVIWIVLRWVVCLPVLVFRGVLEIIVMILKALVFVLLKAPLWCATGLDYLCRSLRRPLSRCRRVLVAVFAMAFDAVPYVLNGAHWCLKALIGLPACFHRICQIIPVAPDYLLLLWADLWAARRGQTPPDDESGEAGSDSPEPEPEPVPRTFLDARRALGLPSEFTPEMFKQAYRAAMKRAHPDAGGTAEAAHAVSEAAEIIRRHKGWA